MKRHLFRLASKASRVAFLGNNARVASNNFRLFWTSERMVWWRKLRSFSICSAGTSDCSFDCLFLWFCLAEVLDCFELLIWLTWRTEDCDVRDELDCWCKIPIRWLDDFVGLLDFFWCQWGCFCCSCSTRFDDNCRREWRSLFLFFVALQSYYMKKFCKLYWYYPCLGSTKSWIIS